jgi:hypothetical protein
MDVQTECLSIDRDELHRAYNGEDVRELRELHEMQLQSQEKIWADALCKADDEVRTARAAVARMAKDDLNRAIAHYLTAQNACALVTWLLDLVSDDTSRRFSLLELV